jgi:hypothetical protein
LFAIRVDIRAAEKRPRDTFEQCGVRSGTGLFARSHVFLTEMAGQTGKSLHMPFDERRNDRQSFFECAGGVGVPFRPHENEPLPSKDFRQIGQEGGARQVGGSSVRSPAMILWRAFRIAA